MAASSWITDPNANDYAQVVTIVTTYAFAFDQAWNNSASLDLLEQQSITTVTQQQFASRGPGPLSNPTLQEISNWAQSAAAAVALIHQCENYDESLGITPPIPGGGGVTSVFGTAPIESSGGETPTISISPATQSEAGSMSASDKATVDEVESADFLLFGETPPSSLAGALQLVAGTNVGLTKSGSTVIVTAAGSGGGVAAVFGSAPIVSSGGIDPTISISPATESAAGSMSAAQVVKLDSLPTAPVTSVTGTAPITSSGGATPAIGISPATESAAGSMSAAAKTTVDQVTSAHFVLFAQIPPSSLTGGMQLEAGPGIALIAGSEVLTATTDLASSAGVTFTTVGNQITIGGTYFETGYSETLLVTEMLPAGGFVSTIEVSGITVPANCKVIVTYECQFTGVSGSSNAVFTHLYGIGHVSGGSPETDTTVRSYRMFPINEGESGIAYNDQHFSYNYEYAPNQISGSGLTFCGIGECELTGGNPSTDYVSLEFASLTIEVVSV